MSLLQDLFLLVTEDVTPAQSSASQQLDQLIQQISGAKRGLEMADRLPADQKARHTSAVVANLSKINANFNNIVKGLQQTQMQPQQQPMKQAPSYQDYNAQRGQQPPQQKQVTPAPNYQDYNAQRFNR